MAGTASRQRYAGAAGRFFMLRPIFLVHGALSTLRVAHDRLDPRVLEPTIPEYVNLRNRDNSANSKRYHQSVMKTFQAPIGALVTVMLFASGCASQPKRTASEEGQHETAKITALLEAWVGGRDVGIVVGLIDAHESKIIAYGKASENGAHRFDGDTIFEIGSVTKAFTGLLLAEMVQRGEVSLDDPISKYLPASVNTPTGDGREITLLHLATHTSGLPRMPSNFAPTNWSNPYADYTVEQLYGCLAECKLTNNMGMKWNYSNLGGGLLGHILARRTGADYETLVRKRICEPLKLRSTRIKLSLGLRARLAPGHDENGKRVPNWDIPTLAGAGALRSTANDMLKFLAANLNLHKSPLATAMQQTHLVQTRTTLTNLSVCLGWHVLAKHNKEIIWHNGETGGYHAFVGFDKTTGRGVVVLTNFKGWIDDIGLHLLDERFEIKRNTG